MKLKDIKQSILRFIGNASISTLAGVLCNTLKIDSVNSEEIDSLIKQKKNFILVFWHGTMLIPWYLHRNEKLVALVSKSKDGQLLAKLLDRWNYKVIRGSSNDGGRVALKSMIDFVEKDHSLCLTPDGPKGPIHKFKAGAVVTAARTGVPLILCGVWNEKKKILSKSWDKFEIPLLFSKVKILYSSPIYIENNVSRVELTKYIVECEEKMEKLQQLAAM
jgi:Uncharacterized protein conserved in bacteria